MTKSTVFGGNILYYSLPASWKRDFIQWKTFYLIWKNHSAISHLWWSVFLAICILRSLPMQRESPEIRTHRISRITQLHYCLIIFQRSWRIQLQEEWQTADELKVIPRQMSLESPILHRRFAQYKNLTAGCKYVQVCVVCSLPYLDRQWGGDAQRTRTELFHILICH